MHEATTYELVLRGRIGHLLLRPLLDDFALDHPSPGRTRLTGVVRDAAHLHGVLAHLTARAIELERVVALEPSDDAEPSAPPLRRDGDHHDTPPPDPPPHDPRTPR